MNPRIKPAREGAIDRPKEGVSLSGDMLTDDPFFRRKPTRTTQVGTFAIARRVSVNDLTDFDSIRETPSLIFRYVWPQSLRIVRNICQRNDVKQDILAGIG